MHIFSPVTLGRNALLCVHFFIIANKVAWVDLGNTKLVYLCTYLVFSQITGGNRMKTAKASPHQYAPGAYEGGSHAPSHTYLLSTNLIQLQL